MSDLATVQQLAERVSQMGYPSLDGWNVGSNGYLSKLSTLEWNVLQEFFTACFNAREELRECIGGYTEEDLDEARTEAYDEGKADGLARLEAECDKAWDVATEKSQVAHFNSGYAQGYEDAKRAPWTSTRDED